MEHVEALLNLGAVLGWSAVAARSGAAVSALASGALKNNLVFSDGFLKAVLFLELYCITDVIRMMTGNLRGNVQLGLVLHYTRTFVLLIVIPKLNKANIADISGIVATVFLSWAVTEVIRYIHCLVGSRVSSSPVYISLHECQFFLFARQQKN